MTSALPADGPAPDDFRPTHVVPRHGMPAWETPGTARPTVPLDPFLPVRLLERTGDWARILCSNGWSAWVDGRLLVSVPEDPPAAARDMARTADPRPLLARAEASLARYRQAAEDLAAGRTDGEGFRRSTGGLRLGVVVEGEAMWLYDAEHERWLYCDGTRLAAYASTSAPSAGAPPRGAGGREPSGPADAVPPPDASGGEHVPGAGAPPPAPGHEPTRVVTTGGPGPARAAPAAEDGGGDGDGDGTDGGAGTGARPPGTPERPAAAEPTRVADVPGAGRGGPADDRAGGG
ncbi:hypothetical protein RND61_15810 [Streptomyces sp. TRM76323]|uniref:Uncharacterized protein n=1 Tax=Streptomyces tamarix TaxID=3078565 RepID=A0ABU3QL69_9ACTN|nr:hypothetical protein [Streptomyces tamarix]MDT9683515.1 hypothetical protein [Streptomyces tamarix]